MRAEIEKTRVELKGALFKVETEIAKTRVEMQRLYVRTVKLLGGFMAGFMVVGLGGFTVVYKYLG